MRVLLLDIDSTIPNLALKKVEKYHLDRGDEVIWNMPMYLNQADKYYASCVFTKNRGEALKYKQLCPELIIGGTGWDLTTKLPMEIDSVLPRINYGFTTRGCIRKCPFCFVPQKEGMIHSAGDIYDIWDGKSKQITLMDNNILALPEHFEKICNQLIKEKLSVDFNQGLDIRLLTPKLCELISKIKFSTDIRFAFDNPKLAKTIRRKLTMLQEYTTKRCLFYVLVGYDTTFEQDMERLNLLKEWGCNAYVMRHENTPNEKHYVRMAEWANQHWCFHKYDFETFCVEYDKDHDSIKTPDLITTNMFDCEPDMTGF